MSEIPLRLLGDNIAIKYDAPDKISDLIVVPDSVEYREPSWATVIATGPGRVSKKGKLVPVGIKVGERVLVAQQHKSLKQSWILSEHIFGRTDIVIIKEEDIFCVDDDG